VRKGEQTNGRTAIKIFFNCFQLIHISSLTYSIIQQIENEPAKLKALLTHEGNILQGTVQDSYFLIKMPIDPTVTSVRLYVAEGD